MRYRRAVASVCRIALLLLVIILLVWAFGIRMPGRNISTAAAPSEDEVALRAELIADVQALAGDIGERNLHHYAQLNRAADFIEDSFSRAGLQPRRDTYELEGRACQNIEAEVRGARSQILMIGAH
jgi:hypothetical protein